MFFVGGVESSVQIMSIRCDYSRIEEYLSCALGIYFPAVRHAC